MRLNMEQSFWFDGVPFDKKDYPEGEFEYIETIDQQSNIFEDYNLFDYMYGTNRYIKLSELFEADSKAKWSTIKIKASGCDSITIFNDVLIENEEVRFIDDFYLKVFYLALKNENPNCYVYETKISVQN